MEERKGSVSGDTSEKEGETFEDAQDDQDTTSGEARQAAEGQDTTAVNGSAGDGKRKVEEREGRGDGDEAQGINEKASTASQNHSTNSNHPGRPDLPPRESNGPAQIGLSGFHAPVQFPPPPMRPPEKPLPLTTSQPTARRNPFAWLSRNTSGQEKKVTSPPLQPAQQRMPRRGTNASTATVGSNPELMLSKIEDANEPTNSGPGRNSLRDRFKLLRMKEEAGITATEVEGEQARGGALAGLIGRSASISFSVGSPSSIVEEGEAGLSSVAAMQGGESTPGSPLKSPMLNPNLPPGTAAGMTAGPTAQPAAEVDWDLWQSVVYEGPAAVAKTSPEELHDAIANGIPSAIRGVVWQVLAQSKNEDLEGVYRELVARGTDKEQRPFNASTPSVSNAAPNGNLKEKESMTSSASSTQSDASTRAVNGQVVPPSETRPGNDVDAAEKAASSLDMERDKRAKDDAAALQKLEKTIRRDLGARTSFSKYLMSAGLQEGLFGVCKAYALFDEAVGYAQGMNFIAMPLLFNMPEEEAFCLLVRLMNQYHLRDMFVADMPGLLLHLYQFERLLEDFEPALYCHLHRRGVTPQLYATQWFLTVFAYRFPLQLVLRVYDLILSEGLEGAILKFGLVLMQRNAATLLAMKDMSALTTFLKERLFDVYIDRTPSASSLLESGFFGSAGGIDKEVYRADTLVQDACAVRIMPEMLKAYTLEWEERQAAEKAHEAELESLRSTNAALAARVRGLEERAEKSDSEHVGLASDLVRTKVENERLRDENESLRGQVEGLRGVVDSQGREVEERLRADMERVTRRNEEVMEENRGLEVQLEEMERKTVEAKVAYAQIHGELETMKQKWKEMTATINSHSVE